MILLCTIKYDAKTFTNKQRYKIINFFVQSIMFVSKHNYNKPYTTNHKQEKLHKKMEGKKNLNKEKKRKSKGNTYWTKKVH
jgi:hypothetical protein